MRGDRARKAFFGSIVLAALGYGYWARACGLFPDGVLRDAGNSLGELRDKWSGKRPLHEFPIVDKEKGKRALINPVILNAPGAFPGTTALSMVAANDKDLLIRLVALDGKLEHEWRINWFEIWPDADHVPEKDLPKGGGTPGTHVHGFVILPSGDVVFNFEHLGLVRLDPCGKVVWRLAYPTHHSVHADEDGTLWVSAQRNHDKLVPRLVNHVPPFVEPMAIQVSVDGKILSEISLSDVLIQNGYRGLLYMSGVKNWSPSVTEDSLHLNDVESFPASKPPGLFAPGDLLVSLRNIHTIFVFARDTKRIKLIRIGEFVRQHDPDFIDGNTISVFDNNAILDQRIPGQEKVPEPSARILILSGGTGPWQTYYTADDFVTSIMGKHQWLPNGNLLVSEPMRGRAFELDGSKRVVWEYLHVVDPGFGAMLEEAQRIPDVVAKAVLSRAARCPGRSKP